MRYVFLQCIDNPSQVRIEISTYCLLAKKVDRQYYILSKINKQNSRKIHIPGESPGVAVISRPVAVYPIRITVYGPLGGFQLRMPVELILLLISMIVAGSILKLTFEIERGSDEIVPGAPWTLTAQFGSRGDEEISMPITQDGPVGMRR
jgi:hypothetical protein